MTCEGVAEERWNPYAIGLDLITLGASTMAHKKGQGSTQNGRDSNAQYRGIKLFGGQIAQAGAVLVSQCGTKWKAGYLVHQGRDYTLTALVEGSVRFRGRSVDIIPSDPSIPRLAIDR